MNAQELLTPVIPVPARGAFELPRTHPGDPSYVPLDLRSAEAFGGQHLADAIDVGTSTALWNRLDRTKTSFVYDADGSTSHRLARQLHTAGFRHVFEIEGGLQAWLAAGLPITR